MALTGSTVDALGTLLPVAIIRWLEEVGSLLGWVVVLTFLVALALGRREKFASAAMTCLGIELLLSLASLLYFCSQLPVPALVGVNLLAVVGGAYAASCLLVSWQVAVEGGGGVIDTLLASWRLGRGKRLILVVTALALVLPGALVGVFTDVEGLADAVAAPVLAVGMCGPYRLLRGAGGSAAGPRPGDGRPP